MPDFFSFERGSHVAQGDIKLISEAGLEHMNAGIAVSYF